MCSSDYFDPMASSQAVTLPPKFLISHVTPMDDQGARGDCWLFSTGRLV